MGAPAPAAEPALQRARVLLAARVPVLDYSLPAAWTAAATAGCAVQVQLGRRRLTGYVVEVQLGPHPEGIALKEVEAVLDPSLALPPAVLQLLLFAADYYRVLPGEMLAAALPPLGHSASIRYALTSEGTARLAQGQGAATPAQWAALQQAGKHARGFTVAALEKALGISRSAAAQRLRTLHQASWVGTTRASAGRRSIAVYSRTPQRAPPAQLSAKAAELLALLPPADQPQSMAELEARLPQARSRMPTLLRLQLATCARQQLTQQPYRGAAAPLPPVQPTAAQAEALAALQTALQAGAFAAFLLHGVTGSGKTEVYLRAIAQVLESGRTALVLVPEIALTPQLGARFRQRFGEQVATFHSGLTPAQRRDEWERVQRGEARIGLGARSALFLPLRGVGIIIVDEEHETSFKQDEAPRYNARDLALVRGRKEHAVVVLGSATPSLESHRNSCTGRYTRLQLPQRVAGRPLPEVHPIDLGTAPRVGAGIFTAEMLAAIEHTLQQDEQVILFLNRRGFAPYVFCRDCGHSYRCDACDVALTLHRRRGVLCCHYCGFEQAAPDTCAACSSHHVGAMGLGTEKIQAEVAQLFGQVPCVRLDRDVVRRRQDLEDLLARFARREARIMIGTQMVAKGHDFPGVTLVGVVSADASLNFPDFRAAERTFSLLTQVSGRAGRGSRAGTVLVQAYDSDHYAIAAARTHAYGEFVEQELVARRELLYPPFAHLALIRCSGGDAAATLARATEVADTLRQRLQVAGTAVTVLGPAAAPLAKLRDLYRFHILLKAEARQALRHALHLMPQGPVPQVHQALDVDPVHML